MAIELTGRTRWFPRKRWFRSPKNVFQVEIVHIWKKGGFTYKEYKWIDGDPDFAPKVRVSDIGVLSVDSNELVRSKVGQEQIEALERMTNKESE
jgi:hypothetical protein